MNELNARKLGQSGFGSIGAVVGATQPEAAATTAAPPATAAVPAPLPAPVPDVAPPPAASASVAVAAPPSPGGVGKTPVAPKGADPKTPTGKKKAADPYGER